MFKTSIPEIIGWIALGAVARLVHWRVPICFIVAYRYEKQFCRVCFPEQLDAPYEGG